MFYFVLNKALPEQLRLLEQVGNNSEVVCELGQRLVGHPQLGHVLRARALLLIAHWPGPHRTTTFTGAVT